MANALQPTPALLCKLGSLIVHYDELHSSNGHAFDKVALDSLLEDKDVQEWLKQMQDMAMIPVKRQSIGE